MTNRIIIDQVSRRLRDVTKKTWQQDILLAALNSAFQSVVNVRPDSNTVHRNMTLVEGHEQRIDDDLYKLVHVLHNVDRTTNQPRRAITKANMGTMDSIFPHWRQDKPRGYIEHYMLDELDDRVFYNWPPARGINAPVTAAEPPVEPVAPQPPEGGFPTQGFDYDNTTGEHTIVDSTNYISNRTSGWVTSYFFADNLPTEDGRYYFESEVETFPTIIGVYEAGTRTTTTSNTVGTSGDSAGYFSGSVFRNNFRALNFSSNEGDIIGMEYEIRGSERLLRYYVNGQLQDGEVQLTDDTDYVPAMGIGSGSNDTPAGLIINGVTYLPDGASQWPPPLEVLDAFQVELDAFQVEFDAFLVLQQEFENTPIGELIRIVAAIVPVVTEADLDEPIPLNSTHHPAIMEWMLYYCYAVDDELTANSGRPDYHFRNFFNLMNTKIQNTLRIQQIRENVDA